MTLKEWLKKNKISQKKFCQMGDFSRSTINNLCAQRTAAGKYTAKRIEKLTKGEVTAESLMMKQPEDAHSDRP